MRVKCKRVTAWIVAKSGCGRDMMWGEDFYRVQSNEL